MARDFDGGTDSLTSDSPPVTAYPYTMSAWVRTTDTATSQAVLWIGDKDVTNHRAFLRIAGNIVGDPVVFTVQGGGAAADANTSSGVTSGVWHHVAAVATSSTDRAVFIDGGSKGTSATDVTPAGIDRIAVGRQVHSSPGAPLTGQVAWTAMWDVALTDAQVAILATGINPRRVRPADLVWVAPLDGVSSPEPDYNFVATQSPLTVNGAAAATTDPSVQPWSLAAAMGVT